MFKSRDDLIRLVSDDLNVLVEMEDVIALTTSSRSTESDLVDIFDLMDTQVDGFVSIRGDIFRLEDVRAVYAHALGVVLGTLMSGRSSKRRANSRRGIAVFL